MSMLTDAKQVRRKDIQSEDDVSRGSTRSPSPDVAAASQLQAKLAALYEDVVEQPCTESPGEAVSGDLQVDQIEQPSNESSYAFKLFSSVSGSRAVKPTSSNSTGETVQRVVISSPSPGPIGSNAGGFLSSRDLGYYMTSHSSDWSTARLAQFADPSVAVSGSWIAAQSHLRNNGLELPWRSRTIKVSQKRFNLLNGLRPGGKTCVLDSDRGSKKTKPNKKRRIILRERQRKKEADRLQRQQRQEDKEREDREKRTRRNREKKVKKKEKLKAKKAQTEPTVNNDQ